MKERQTILTTARGQTAKRNLSEMDMVNQYTVVQ